MTVRAKSLFWFCWLACFSAEKGGAADENASSPPPASLTSAKHDYEMVKALEVPPEQSKLLLPPDQIPVLQSKSDGPPTLSLLERERLDEAKSLTKTHSKNWLLDAMAAKPVPGKPDARSSEVELTVQTVDETTGTKLAASGSSRAAMVAERSTLRPTMKSEATASPNPLAAYLAGWLTPGDFAMLKPTGEGSVDPLRDARVGNKDAAAHFELPTGSIDLMVTSVGQSQAAPTQNPYLSDLVGPTAGSSLLPSSVSAGLKPVETKTFEQPSHLTETPERSAPGPQPANDLLKADEDAKYFKQLKRF
jgi:hypothetical protein